MAVDSRVLTAVNNMLIIAADNSHGYDQQHRWGPDYDCSSLVITCFDLAGFNIKENGGTYTGNLAKALEKTGFTNVAGTINITTQEGLERGDILLRPNGYYAGRGGHVCVYLGQDAPTTSKLVEAYMNENHASSGGKTGDQTGQEIRTRSYYVNKGWPFIFRWIDGSGGSTASNTSIIKIPKRLRRGNKYIAITRIQMILKELGFYTDSLDGIFGKNTEDAVKNFQKKNSLDFDGIIGPQTYIKLLEVGEWNNDN